MHVFVTGASGYIGSAVNAVLVRAGHQVIALARSAESAERLAAAGLQTRRGDVDDPQSLTAAAESATGWSTSSSEGRTG